MINAVVADAVNMSQRERIMARVEDSARQLGMHIAELREYAEAVAVETEAASEGSDAAESEVD